MITYLREERARIGLTQSDVAEKVQVGKATYVRWEQGSPIPSDKLALLNGLGFDISYVVTGKRISSVESGIISLSPDCLEKALTSFLYNTAELGLLTKSQDADVASLVNMALYTICKEAGISLKTEEKINTNKKAQ